MMKVFVNLVICLSIFLGSCNSKTTSGEVSNNETGSKSSEPVPKTGENITYYPGTEKIQARVNYVEGVRNGLATNYYKDGQERLVMSYKDGLKEGATTSYYEDGSVWKKGFYKNNKKEGLFTTYYRSGQLKSEFNFIDGNRCFGGQEYRKDGKKQIYPRIHVKEVDNLFKKNEYVFEFSLSNKSKKVEFFLCKPLKKSERLTLYSDGVDYSRLQVKKGVGVFQLKLPRGTYFREDFEIVAQYKTLMGNKILLSKPLKVNVVHKM